LVANRTAGPLNTKALHEGGDIWFDCGITSHDTARAISLGIPHSHHEPVESGQSTRRLFNGDSEWGDNELRLDADGDGHPSPIFPAALRYIAWVPDSEQDEWIQNTQTNGNDPLTTMDFSNLIPIERYGGTLSRTYTSPGSYTADEETGEDEAGFYFNSDNPVGTVFTDLDYHFPGILFKPKWSDYDDDMIGKEFKVKGKVALPRGVNSFGNTWAGDWIGYNVNITGSLNIYDIQESPEDDTNFFTKRKDESFIMLSGDDGLSSSIPVYPYTPNPSWVNDGNTWKTVSFIWRPQNKKSALYLCYVGDDIGVEDGWSEDTGGTPAHARFWFDDWQITEMPSNEGYGIKGGERRDRYWAFDKAFFNKPKSGIADVMRINGDDSYGTHSNFWHKINDTGVTYRNLVTGAIANNKIKKIETVDWSAGNSKGYANLKFKECAWMDATCVSSNGAADAQNDITVTEVIDDIDGGTCFQFAATSADVMLNELHNCGSNHFQIYRDNANTAHKGITAMLYVPTAEIDDDEDRFIPMRKYTFTCKVKGHGPFFNIGGESSHYFQAVAARPWDLTTHYTGTPFGIIGYDSGTDSAVQDYDNVDTSDDDWGISHNSSEAIKIDWNADRWHTYRMEFMFAQQDSMDIGIKFCWFNYEMANSATSDATLSISDYISVKDIKIVDSAATSLYGSTFVMNRLPEMYDLYKYWNSTTPLASNCMGGPDIPENLSTHGFATGDWDDNLTQFLGEQYGTHLAWKALYTQIGVPENSGRYKHLVDSNAQGITGQYFWMIKIPSYHQSDSRVYNGTTMSMKNFYWKLPIFKRNSAGFSGHLTAGMTGETVQVATECVAGTYGFGGVATNATTNNNLVRGWKHVWSGKDYKVLHKNLFHKVKDLGQNADLLELGISYGTGMDYEITLLEDVEGDGSFVVEQRIATNSEFSNSFSRGGFSRARLSQMKADYSSTFTPSGSNYPNNSTYRVYTGSGGGTATMGTGGFYPLGLNNNTTNVNGLNQGIFNANTDDHYTYENSEEIVLENPLQLSELQAYAPDGARGVCVLAPPEGGANLSIFVSPGGAWSNTASSKWEFGYTYVYYANQESDIYWYPDDVDLFSGFIGDSSKLRDGFQLEIYPVIHMGFPKGVEGLRFYAKKVGDKNAFLIMNCNFEKGIQSNSNFTTEEWTPWQCLRDLEDTWVHSKAGQYTDEFTQGIVSGIGNIDQEPMIYPRGGNKHLGWSKDNLDGSGNEHFDYMRSPDGRFPDGNNGTTVNVNNNFYENTNDAFAFAEGFTSDDQLNYHSNFNQTRDINEGSKIKQHNQVWTSAQKVISKSVGFTYESLNGFNYGENPFFSKEGEGWATSVLLNRKVYIGNVRKYDKNDILQSYPDEMWISQVDRHDTFPAKNKLAVTINDGDEIIALHQFADRILQFKRNNLFVINCSEDVEFLEGKYPFMGLDFKNSGVSTEVGVIWANTHGVYLYDGGSILSLHHKEAAHAVAGKTKNIRVISKESWQEFAIDDNGNPNPMLITYSPKAKAVYIFDKGTDTNRGWKYHVITKSWVALDDGGAGGIRFDDNTKERTNYQVSNTGDPVCIKVDDNNTNLMMVKFDEKDPTGMAASTNFKLITKEFNFDTSSVLKNFIALNLVYKSTGDTLVIPYYSTDSGSNWNTFSASDTRFAPEGGAALDGSGLLDTGGEEKMVRLKAATVLKDIKTIQFRFISGSNNPPVDFKISSIEAIYRQKGVRT